MENRQRIPRMSKDPIGSNNRSSPSNNVQYNAVRKSFLKIAENDKAAAYICITILRLVCFKNNYSVEFEVVFS